MTSSQIPAYYYYIPIVSPTFAESGLWGITGVMGQWRRVQTTFSESGRDNRGCSLQYSKDVKNAGADIARLERETINLKEVSVSGQGLLQGPNGARLEASHKLVVAVNDSL